MGVAKQYRHCIGLLLGAAATVQVVALYLSRVPSAFSLEAFEQGRAPVPFQHRLALRPLLAWAHGSARLQHVAAWLTRQHAWFPHGVRPEALVELPLDVLAVAATGWMAERMYARASPTGMLRGFVYPLTLIMVAVVFDLSTMHSLRFVYDLPAMAVFAGGLFLLYTEQPLWRFTTLFTAGTVNRETTLLLLAALLLQRCTAKRLWLAVALTAGWVGWHLYVTHLFAGNVSAAGPRFLLNLGVLLCPFAWPQLGLFAAVCLLPLLLGKVDELDPLLLRWLVLLPLWFAFMLQYGLLLETRVFGELIGFLAPVGALLLESLLLQRIRTQPLSESALQRVITRVAKAAIVS